MTFIDGFILAVPKKNKQKYIDHAKSAVPIFNKLGATRLVECWGDWVPEGKVTDFRRATLAEDDEQALFSWVEYPDKSTRDSANDKMMNDPAMSEGMGDMPFDGKRMIFGGFEPVVERGSGGKSGYVGGYVAPAPSGNKEAYQAMCSTMADVALDLGALRVLDCWGSDLPAGKINDFRSAVGAEKGENVVFGFVEWSSKKAYDEAMPKMREDERMSATASDMPIDGKRLIFGGFEVIVDE